MKHIIEPLKKVKEKREGFTLNELFQSVDRLVEKANRNDNSAKEILDSAREKYEKSSQYAL